MKLSEYIKVLEALKAEHGDLEVETMMPDWSRATAQAPQLAYRKVLNPRERREEFWWRGAHGDDRKGEKVVKV